MTISGTPVPPPTHSAGPANGACSTGFRAELHNGNVDDSGSLFDVAGTRKVPIIRGDTVAVDAVLNANIYYCGHDNQIHAVAIEMFPVSSGTDIAPWESEMYSPGVFTQAFQESGGFYQSAPFKNVDIGKTFALVARVVDDPGAMMDDNVLAEDAEFDFTVCQTYDEFNCK